MTGNQVVSTMFNFDTCIRMVRFVLHSGGDKDPGSFLTDSGCVGVYSVCIVAYIHIVCLMAMFKFESLTHRSTVYFWWLCPDLSHIDMDT
jgi:hypothetical protein